MIKDKIEELQRQIRQLQAQQDDEEEKEKMLSFNVINEDDWNDFVTKAKELMETAPFTHRKANKVLWEDGCVLEDAHDKLEEALEEVEKVFEWRKENGL